MLDELDQMLVCFFLRVFVLTFGKFPIKFIRTMLYETTFGFHTSTHGDMGELSEHSKLAVLLPFRSEFAHIFGDHDILLCGFL